MSLDKIVAAPARARRALGSLGLVPGQPAGPFAAELIVAGLEPNGLGTLVSLTAWRAPMTARTGRPSRSTSPSARPPLCPTWSGGLVLLSGGTGALGSIAAGMILSAVKAVSDARAPLVEINR